MTRLFERWKPAKDKKNDSLTKEKMHLYTGVRPHSQQVSWI